jgi:hypothetical protein
MVYLNTCLISAIQSFMGKFGTTQLFRAQERKSVGQSNFSVRTGGQHSNTNCKYFQDKNEL